MPEQTVASYTDEQIRDVIEEAVGEFGDDSYPRWYAITGSHVYGINSESSDVDVRGIHTTSRERYAQVHDTPKQEVRLNMDGVTEGYEHVSDIDLRSYELRHFGEHLLSANFNIMELVMCAPQVMNGIPLSMDALRGILRAYLPLDVPNSYLGMAKSNYYSYLDPDKSEAYDPVPKKFLYVYRALLAAIYTEEQGKICADVTELAKRVDIGNPSLVQAGINAKRDQEVETVPDELESWFRDEIADAFTAQPEFQGVDHDTRESYGSEIDRWMETVRA